MWSALGLTDDLTIEGNALIVRKDVGNVGASWTEYGGDKGGNRYVAASQINTANVDRLTIAWTHKSGAFDGKSDEARQSSALQTTPILVEESLVFCTQFNEVIAVDPGTGEEKWRYDPDVPTDSDPANQYTCRGVSYWKDERANKGSQCSARLFTGTVDARLIALDAKTGKPCEDFGTGGTRRIQPSISLRWPGEFQITSAPAIIGDTVVTGTSIGDNLRTDAPKGTVFAFDVRTGETKWTFDPLSGSPDIRGGHSNVWSTISIDEARKLVIIPTSSPSPDYYGGNRPGDNLYANSVVALNAETGTVAWHFQTVHHDIWDYDLPAQPGLYQVWRNGKAHDVVAQVTKTGLVFVLDRDTGEPFLPVEERAVPQQAEKGETISPTQPFPVGTPNIVPDRVDPSDAFGLTLWDRLACKAQLENLRAEGLFTPPTIQGTLSLPFTGGGANWGSAAFDPRRNLLVINMNNIGQYTRLQPNVKDGGKANKINDDDEFAPMEGAPYGMTRAVIVSPLGLPCTPPPWGVLAGIDLDSGKIVWRQILGTTEDLAPGGFASKLGTPALGGPIVTAGGLVFIGATSDHYLRAFEAATGKELWKGRLPAGGQATPMSYVWKGRQYVVIAAGGASNLDTKLGDNLVAFALPR
ncbi:pyrroloquinoline quinone-dependent dehydrogenase [Sphingorhabdus sp. M41]|uniref:pyrroloquinoline quinone-dependent dehydrogenase n=1 Tax=Sphingorhabdus sp. M41 TaxID=1806885 RepID=UPI0009EE798E|nr:pyrroloquinoline quinone-dependent dehydrogenase [Sphingorhabdus sp. M41]